MTDKEKIVPLKNFYIGVDERFHVAVHEIAGNDWVEHADYAALESKFAAQAARIEQLTAENFKQNEFIAQRCYVFDGNQSDVSDAYLCATADMPETPATDAALRETQIAGLIKFAERMETENPELAADSNRSMKAVAWAARAYANKILSGEVPL